MTVQELREEIVQKTEEINGYLESRDADKAEEALAEKRKLQKLLAVREAEDDEEREDLGRQKKQKESRTTGAVNELRIFSTTLKITARLYRLRTIYRKTKPLISYRKLLSRTSRKLGLILKMMKLCRS